MPIYISLLRGINVSGQKKIKMTDLKAMYKSLGFKNIVSYIQSGNVLFESKATSFEKLEIKIKGQIQKTFGFEVPTLVFDLDFLKKVITSNPYYTSTDMDIKPLYVTFLKAAPAEELVKALQTIELPDQYFEISGKKVYLNFPKGYGRTKLDNNFLERKLKVQATTRNWRTTLKLQELAQELHAGK